MHGSFVREISFEAEKNQILCFLAEKNIFVNLGAMFRQIGGEQCEGEEREQETPLTFISALSQLPSSLNIFLCQSGLFWVAEHTFSSQHIYLCWLACFEPA